MKNIPHFLVFLFVILSGNIIAQNKAEKHTLSGYIRDNSTGEDLIGATIKVKQLGTGAATNVYGFYSLTLPEGFYTFEINYIGYQTQLDSFNLTESKTLNFSLKTSDQVLKEFVVAGTREDENVTKVEMSVEKMSISTIKEIPQLLGEADVIKSIQLRPGVTSVGEGASGFNVRGGNIDQNLILLDEAPVYNSSHLFGFFSVFNPDAIKDVTLYKGGIPSKYGGRLSSVMDVRQRDGNNKKFSGTGGIGILFSRITLEGPIVKDKVSFLVSGRRSYADLYLKLREDLKDNQAYFYDLNAKISWKINEKNRIFASGYFGDDVFGFGEDFKMKWGNATGTVRWNHIISDKHFLNVTGVYSDYSYSLGVPQGTSAFEWSSRILNKEGKVDFTYFASPKITLDYGAEYQHYEFTPGNVNPLGDESIFTSYGVQKEYAHMPSVYVGASQNVGSKLKFQYGLRYTHYFNVGSYDLNIYKDGVPTTKEEIVDVISYEKGETVADYGGLEPRLAASYILNKKQSFKASYQRTNQYMHLISNTTSATPIDVWKPAGYYVKPSQSDQYVLGYFRNFKKNVYEFSVETYYKEMRNLVDYRNGAELLLNDNLETELLSGDGKSYGLELMINKKKGNLTGWIAYTLSKTTMTVPGFSTPTYKEAANGINGGKAYATNWDKTHDLTVVAMYDLNEKWKFSGNFIFMTGRPATYPNGGYVWDGKILPDYRTRNSARIPSTHRLDISATYKLKDKGERYKHSIAFGLYNVYGNKNPYSIYFTQSEENPLLTEAKQLSIIGMPVPFVTYNFKF
ncbi:MAG: TonB-dependent receptor [Salibacteraceae bacterium]